MSRAFAGMTRRLLIPACVAGMTETEALRGGCVLATGCEQGGAKNQAQEGYCRLPIADCRLPIADCRLPIADCRLPIADSTATAFAVKLVWLVCVMSFPLVLCQ